MAKFKVKVDYPQAKINSRITREVNDILGEEELSKIIGNIVVERVAFSAKRGKPLNDSKDFPTLDDKTIERRAELSEFNKTTNVYKADRSNLSFTGQLLNSLSFVKLKSKAFLVEIMFSGNRTPYKTGPKSTAKLTDANRTNQALAETLNDKGFTVFSAKGIESEKALIRRIVNEVRSYIRKNLR